LSTERPLFFSYCPLPKLPFSANLFGKSDGAQAPQRFFKISMIAHRCASTTFYFISFCIRFDMVRAFYANTAKKYFATASKRRFLSHNEKTRPLRA